MKTFFSTLFGILVAAAIIGFAAWVYQARQQAASRREHVRQLTLDSEMTKAGREWDEQTRRYPQFDPNAEKLRARLHEIKEASDAGRRIPPSADTPATGAALPSATATPAKVVTITQPLSIAVPHGSVGVAPGTRLPFVSRAGDKVRVRYYDGADYDIPISATDLK